MKKIIGILLIVVMITMAISDAQATLPYETQLEVSSAFSEIRGHIWAIESNIDTNIEPRFEHDIAMHVPQHGGHPIIEVYPGLAEIPNVANNPSISALHRSLQNLYENAESPSSVSTATLLDSASKAKTAVDNAQTAVLGAESDTDLQLNLDTIKFLVTLSADEYDAAMIDGKVELATELQDAYAFHKISSRVIDKIGTSIANSDTVEIKNLLNRFVTVYHDRDDPAKSTAIAATISAKLDAINPNDIHMDKIMNDKSIKKLSDKEQQVALEHVASIRQLLIDAKSEYASNPSESLALVKNAYLNHFEFIEDDLKDIGQEELMETVEHNMRDNLIRAINAGDSNVPQMIDDVLVELDMVESVVPEFGVLTLAILVITVTATIALTFRSQLFARLY